MTLEERKEKALDLRRRGYNCAQTVILCFNDLLPLDEPMLARLSSALGTGVAASREICGVANGIAIVIGMRHGAEPSEKVAASREAYPLIEAFRNRNCGRVRCSELKDAQAKCGAVPCNDLILQGIEILHEHLSQ